MLTSIVFLVLNFLKVLNHSRSELVGGGETPEVPGSNLSVLEDLVDGLPQLVGVFSLANVVQHLNGAEEHGCRVGNVLT